MISVVVAGKMCLRILPSIMIMQNELRDRISVDTD